jgi:hypothetical protein
MFKTLLAIIFGTRLSVKSNKQVDKKIADMNAKGAGIWVNEKFIHMG